MRNCVFIVLLSLSYLTTLAQKKATITEMVHYQTQTMTQELDLNKEQIGKVDSINIKYTEKTVILIEADGSMFGKMGKMKTLQKSKNSELENVLTEEQFERYENNVQPRIRKYMRKNMRI